MLLSQAPPLSSTGLLVPEDSGLKILAPRVQGLPQMWSQSQESCDRTSCPENLGSRFSSLHFIDGNLRPRGKPVGMAAPDELFHTSPPLWVPVSTPSRVLETPSGQPPWARIPEGWGLERNDSQRNQALPPKHPPGL